MIGKCFDIENFRNFSFCQIEIFFIPKPLTYQNSFWIFVFRNSQKITLSTWNQKYQNFSFFMSQVKKSDSLGANSNWYHQLEQIQLGWKLGSSSYQFSILLLVHPREKLGDGCYSHWLNQSFSLQSKALYCPFDTWKKF